MEAKDISNLIDGTGAVIRQELYSISGSQLSELMIAWKQAGIREAIEGIEKVALKQAVGGYRQATSYNRVITESKWQAKLKELESK